jgi:hypothetical protein
MKRATRKKLKRQAPIWITVALVVSLIFILPSKQEENDFEAEFASATLEYETENTCSEDRLYLLPGFADMPDWMKEERDPFPEAQFSRDCALLAMKVISSAAQKKKSYLFTKCSVKTPITQESQRKVKGKWIKTSKIIGYAESDVMSPEGEPTRGYKAPCMTKEYVNSIYNAFVDTSECFNMHQTDLLSKLFNESGLHVNIYGGLGHDAGIGQLTGTAINSVLEKYWLEGGKTTVLDYYKAEIEKTGKNSCHRLLLFPPAFERINPSSTNRCSLISTPENPYRNLVYTAMFYRTMLHGIAGIKYQYGKDYVETPRGLQEVLPGENFEPGGWLAKYEIKKNLKRLGIKNPDMSAVTRSMVMLGYNAGPHKAVSYLDTYLRNRLKGKKPLYLKSKDLDFTLTDFLKSLKPVVANGGDALARARKTAHLKSLPEFLMLVQESGTPGYISRVAEWRKYLITYMGDNRCVSNYFIRF